MAERRKGRKAVKEEEPADGLSKENETIAKHVRFNCATKVGMFEGNEVHYFTGRKAIDTLVESKKYGAEAKEPKFANRAQADAFLTKLLQGGLFFRAKVLVAKKKDDPRRGKGDKSEKVGESPRVRRLKQQEDEDTAGDSSADNKKEEQPKKEEETKKKKKIKLVVHDHQVFNDDSDVYVWIFDPTPFYKQVIGLLIVLGVILACLFPLWPDWLRLGVYYLSVAGISLFGLLLGVALLRTVLFGIIYVTTMGRHNLWILPNLTEDCGFFESFKPFYTYEYCAPGDDNKKKDKKKKKDSDEEPLIEDIEETPKSVQKSKKKTEKLTAPPDPEPEKPQEETDPEEKYSKSGSDNEEENSSAEEDEVSENGTQGESNNGSTGDSSEPADVVKIDDDAQNKQEDEPAEESQTTPAPANKSRRRRVRRADDDGFVMVQGTDGN